MSSISAGTTASTTLVHSGDTTGSLVFKTNDTGSGGTTAVTIDTSQNVKLSAAGTKILNSSGNPILQQTGSVLQVLQTVKVDSYSSSATTWTDVTGISVSITPTSSSSKILVICNWSVGIDGTSNPDIMARLVRGSTAIAIGNNGGTDSVSAMPISGSQTVYTTFSNSVTYLDSPATTSSTTYKLQMRNWSSSNTYYVGQRGLNASFIIPSFITVMEIAA